MNIPARVSIFGLAGCFCSIVLYTGVPSIIHAADAKTTQRHSLIVRPSVSPPAFVTTGRDDIAQSGAQRPNQLSLVTSGGVQQVPRFVGRNSLNQLIPLGTQLPASLASRSTRDLPAHREATAAMMNPLAAPTLNPIVRTPVAQTPASFSPSSLASTLSAATVTWNAHSETALAGYKVYVGTAPGSYGFAGPFDAQRSTTYTVSGLSAGQTYYFAVSAYDSSGHESPLSNEVTKTITK